MIDRDLADPAGTRSERDETVTDETVEGDLDLGLDRETEVADPGETTPGVGAVTDMTDVTVIAVKNKRFLVYEYLKVCFFFILFSFPKSISISRSILNNEKVLTVPRNSDDVLLTFKQPSEEKGQYST